MLGREEVGNTTGESVRDVIVIPPAGELRREARVVSQKWWIIGGIGERDESRGWIIPNGVVTLLLGLLILFGWPGSTLWVLGTFLGVDLIVEGVTFVVLGFSLRRALRPGTA